ncbi:MAG TPA: 8-amino-7-oxononanoate synthase [Opitutales bacterium]|nr:8-amino-7-oxononanoate synthase [Opitutales bacterium]
MTDKTFHSTEMLQARLHAELEERAVKGRRRELCVAGPVRVNLADNDYLGLSQDAVVKAAVRAALADGAVSASSSPLVRGYQEIHAKLEKTLCAWHGFSSGLVWNSGFAANQAVLGTLARPGDWVFVDRLAHHSLISGILKSNARLKRFPHNNLKQLKEALEQTATFDGVRWVVTESVFSMDGDGPDLRALAELKQRHNFVWLLDEAHALGWYGPQGQGRAAEAGVVDAVDIFIGTFGKTLGAMGAYSLFHEPLLRESLVNHAGEFIYSTYLSPLMAAAALAAIGRVRELAPEAKKWREKSTRLRELLRTHHWDTPPGDSPIVPVQIGKDETVLALGSHVRASGFAVGAIRPPTVPEGTARLRLSLKSETRWEDLEELVQEMNTWRNAQTKL